MEREPVTIFLGQFAGSPEKANENWISNKAQWLGGHRFRSHPDGFFIPPGLRRERGEVFGLVKRVATGYRVCNAFNEELFPGWVRFAILRATVSLHGARGPEGVWIGHEAERARQLLGSARSAGWCYVFDLGDEVPFNIVLTEMASLVHTFRIMWSRHQNRVVRLYKELGRQKAVAERLGVTQQAVSDILRRAHWREVRRAEKLIDSVLQGIEPA